MSSDDDRQHAPATARNRGPILDVLRSILPSSGTVLEVASGTGEHVVHFARALPMLKWHPSDPSSEARRSIDAWIAAEGLANVRSPLDLDAACDNWPTLQPVVPAGIRLHHHALLLPPVPSRPH